MRSRAFTDKVESPFREFALRVYTKITLNVSVFAGTLYYKWVQART